jgi:hypothetical protein
MTAKSRIDAAQLFWGGNTLWLGPWKAATLEPVWYGGRRDTPPNGWKACVGCVWENDSEQAHDAAMRRAEWVAMGQLRSIGIRAAEFTRQDGTKNRLEMP